MIISLLHEFIKKVGGENDYFNDIVDEKINLKHSIELGKVKVVNISILQEYFRENVKKYIL